MHEQRILTTAEALREAADICLEKHDNVFVIGEGVTDPKAIFGTTLGLAEKFGPSRVIEMPVAENGLTGVVVGAALMGMRPILVHQRVDFALLSVEQIFNNAAKTHYITQGKHQVPLVIRMIIGRGWGQGPAHSQSLESIFAHIPGLKVLMPSTAGDSKAMLIAAVEEDNPVIMIEHRWIHYFTGDVPEGYCTTSLDGPARLREGNACTVVATSYMTIEAMRACDALNNAGVAADLFDLRVLRPLNLDAIVDSVRRTGRLLVVDTGFKTLGIGAEVVSSVVEQCFGELKKTPIRLGLPGRPTPSSRALLEGFYPRSIDIMDAICDLSETPAGDVSTERDQLMEEIASLPGDVPNLSFIGPF